MRELYTALSAVLIFAFTSPVNAITDIPDCANSEYRRAHPEKCATFSPSMVAPTLSGVAVLGGALALIGMAGTSDAPAQSSDSYSLSATPQYDMVGADITDAQLNSILHTPEYQDNFNHYNEIRAAYSIARGYTGAGSTIAVLDTGLDSWHGRNVAAMASGIIAPNAQIDSYKIAYDMEYVSYREIGNIIASAHDADIFNSSWSVPMRATELKSREQLIRITDANFVNQLSNAAKRDAIFVWAAGNDYDKTQSSALSAMPAVMPELNGHFINVVAWDSETGALADYSNACGITQNWCITAPGTDINTGTSIATGTSFAAPIVSAAVAVIREAFPYMSAPEITSLLFETARDIGAPGTDSTYGHGMLDLERATRPVGTALIPMPNGSMHPLQTARVSGTIAKNIKDANVQFAFFDKYGRAFDTDINNSIKIQNPGRGFMRLRSDNETTLLATDGIEIGLMNSDIMFGDSFMQSDQNPLFGFIGTHSEQSIGDVKLFQRARIGFGAPRASENSIITNFSNIYTASVEFGTQIQDWTISVSIPDTVIAGSFDMRLASGRSTNGSIIYNDYNIDMRGRPSIEYSISYKSITASFIDNPYGTDEFFIMTRGQIRF